jgi:N-acetylglucosaminyldiphosphoundecaprenol N-acetyl-beta-D-mannosaminyltransferase
MTTTIATRSLWGVPIAAVRQLDVLDLVHDAIVGRRRLKIGVVNAAKIVNMRRDPKLSDDVRSSDIILADGIAVVWASRLLRRPLPERVTGIDLMFAMLERGSRHGYRVFCLGATDDVVAAVASRIKTDYPGVNVVGVRNGYFTDAQEAEVAAEIAAADPDILFVAMTSPKKENFMGRWADRLPVRVYHGVGGSFDVMAGKVSRAPALWQGLGLEWLYRVKQEPRRLWRRYLVTNTLFVALVLRELFLRSSIRNRPHRVESL